MQGTISLNSKKSDRYCWGKFNNSEVIKINLKAVSVNKKLNEYAEIRKLIGRAFPKNEQFPMWLLRILAIRKSVDFLAYYDNDSFCGISYTVNSDDLVFVLYLAVNDKIRSKGYGSQMIQYIKQMHPNKVVALNIEPLDPTAENYAQRIKRFEFYKKNDFVDTHCKIIDSGEGYQILSTADRFPLEAYKSAIKRLSFGIYSSKVLKIKA